MGLLWFPLEAQRLQNEPGKRASAFGATGFGGHPYGRGSTPWDAFGVGAPPMFVYFSGDWPIAISHNVKQRNIKGFQHPTVQQLLEVACPKSPSTKQWLGGAEGPEGLSIPGVHYFPSSDGVSEGVSFSPTLPATCSEIVGSKCCMTF